MDAMKEDMKVAEVTGGRRFGKIEMENQQWRDLTEET